MYALPASRERTREFQQSLRLCCQQQQQPPCLAPTYHSKRRKIRSLRGTKLPTLSPTFRRRDNEIPPTRIGHEAKRTRTNRIRPDQCRIRRRTRNHMAGTSQSRTRRGEIARGGTIGEESFVGHDSQCRGIGFRGACLLPGAGTQGGRQEFVGDYRGGYREEEWCGEGGGGGETSNGGTKRGCRGDQDGRGRTISSCCSRAATGMQCQ
mmetsp:Transcript_17952/g.39141  ORF Transcript_17952/g.39141 Transcript_17952/m.39141 type:complete len:208 (-) Transcript_17952:201-824(-)